MLDVAIRTVTGLDLERCFEIESVSYSGDEAASKEKIRRRILSYHEGFIVLENKQEIIGFINSGATDEVDLADAAFKELAGHDPDGQYVVILSVAVHPDYQGNGFARMLMNDFVRRMKAMDKLAIYLICQKDLISMYARFGFVDFGPSGSAHGGMAWNEMRLLLKDLPHG